MKTRNSYVSNSSSSSFVVIQTPEKNPFSRLTAQDWLDAIDALYMPYNEDPPMSEDFRYAEVLDLRADRKAALAKFGNDMRCWFAGLSVWRDGEVVRDPAAGHSAISRWEEYINFLSCGKKKHGAWGEGYRDADGYAFCHAGWPLDEEETINKGLSKYMDGEVLYRPLPDALASEVREKWRSCGACTQLDVMKSESAAVFVHFAENDIWRLKGAMDDGKGLGKDVWKTPEWTFSRVMEVFARWFRENGRVRKNASWKSLYRIVGGLSLHEG